MDGSRCRAVLQEVEASAQQNTDTEGAMGMHKIRVVLPFYSRASSGL